MKRSLSWVIATALLINALSGCAGGTAQSSPPVGAENTNAAQASADPNAPIVLRFATGSSDALTVLNELAVKFNEENPNVTVEYTL